MRGFLLVSIVPAVALLLSGCSDVGDPVAPSGGDDPVSYAADIQPLFDAGCVGCHGQGGQGGLDLRPGVSRGNLVGVVSAVYGARRVDPGNPDGSVLYDKLADGGAYGQPMPPSGSGFTADELELVRRWIADGAQDD